MQRRERKKRDDLSLSEKVVYMPSPVKRMHCYRSQASEKDDISATKERR